MGKNSCHEKQCVFHHRSHFFFFFPKKIVFSPEKHQPQGQSGPWTRDINVNGVALLDLIRW